MQKACDENFDRILKDEREIHGMFEEDDILAEEGSYGPDLPPPSAPGATRLIRSSSSNTALSSSSCLNSERACLDPGFKSRCINITCHDKSCGKAVETTIRKMAASHNKEQTTAAPTVASASNSNGHGERRHDGNRSTTSNGNDQRRLKQSNR